MALGAGNEAAVWAQLGVKGTMSESAWTWVPVQPVWIIEDSGAPEASNTTSHRTYLLCMPSVMFILFIISTHGTVTAALCVY